MATQMVVPEKIVSSAVSETVSGKVSGKVSTKPGENSLTAAVAKTPLREIKKTLPLRVLSAADFEHWQMYGFVVVRQAVPAENVERLVKLLWEFQEMDPANTETWYAKQLRDHAMKELNYSGMVEVYNHQYLWDNRQSQRVYDAFVDIWDEEKLWVTIDRANLNTPNRRRARLFRVHSYRLRHDARSAADQRSGGAVAGGCGRRDGRLSMRTGAVSDVRRVEEDAAGRPRRIQAGHHGLRGVSGADEGGATC